MKFNSTCPKMNITFFKADPTPKRAPASLSVRPSGSMTLNTAGVIELTAEAGGSAALGFDADGKRWLLAYWPDGHKQQPVLRLNSAKSGAQLRFTAKPAALALYASLPPALQDQKSIIGELQGEALTDEQWPGCRFYELRIAALADAVPTAKAAPVAPKTAAKTQQPGVGRGRYARRKQRETVAA